MNSKTLPIKKALLILVLAGLMTSSCGVKNDPIPPGGIMLPSLIDKYSVVPKEKSSEQDERKANKKASSENSKEE